MRLYKAIRLPFPNGWTPERGEYVVVPSVTQGSRNAWTAVVEKVLGDVVTVRLRNFNLGRQQYLVRDIRPHPHYKLGSRNYGVVGGIPDSVKEQQG